MREDEFNHPYHYRCRQQQEYALVRSAIEPSTRDIHLDLARRYAHL